MNDDERGARVLQRIKTFHARNDGQTMAEYALVLGVIAAATVAAVTLLSFAVGGKLGSVASTITSLLP